MSVAYTALCVLSPVFSSSLNNGFDLKVVETLAAWLILKKKINGYVCLFGSQSFFSPPLA